MLPLRRKIFSYGRGGKRRTDPRERRLIGSGDDHHGAPPAFLPERPFQKFSDLAPALAHDEENRARYVVGRAQELPFADGSFDSAGCFTMLHHVPSTAAQNRLLAEVQRVLRPGGALIGSDSLPSDRLHQLHEADTYNPVEPGTLVTRLQTIGFDRITVNVDGTMKFIAHKPADDRGA